MLPKSLKLKKNPPSARTLAGLKGKPMTISHYHRAAPTASEIAVR
jgi:hypothetical protein